MTDSYDPSVAKREEITCFATKVPRRLLHRLEVHLAIEQKTVRAWFASVLEKLPPVPGHE